MAKTKAQIFNDKISLIYEYDKTSPLFVKQAAIEIENNNVEKAVKILSDGLQLYPHYASAHLLLGRALALTANYDQAIQSVKTGSELINSSRTYDFYKKQIDNIKSKNQIFGSGDRNAFWTFEESEPESKPIQQELPAGGPEVNRIKEAGRKLQEANREDDTDSVLDKKIEKLTGETIIVSDTLAKIYAAQGELSEAIEIYKKLIIKNPSKEAYYNEKINELKTRLE